MHDKSVKSGARQTLSDDLDNLVYTCIVYQVTNAFLQGNFDIYN